MKLLSVAAMFRCSRPSLVSLTLCVLVTPAVAAKSTLKCQVGGVSTITRAICASPEYLAMDREIVALLDRAEARFAPVDAHRLAVSQGAFLKKREGCEWASHNSAHPGAAVDECLRSVMDARVHALRTAVDRGSL